jgi:hypothetical protein
MLSCGCAFSVSEILVANFHSMRRHIRQVEGGRGSLKAPPRWRRGDEDGRGNGARAGLQSLTGGARDGSRPISHLGSRYGAARPAAVPSW